MEAKLGAPGDHGRARKLPQSLSSAFTSAGDSQIPTLWPVSALSVGFRENLACGWKGLSQVGGQPCWGWDLTLDNRDP